MLENRPVFLVLSSFFGVKILLQRYKKAHSRIHRRAETGLFMPLLTNPYRGSGGTKKAPGRALTNNATGSGADKINCLQKQQDGFSHPYAPRIAKNAPEGCG
jgi:hypothetical protein